MRYTAPPHTADATISTGPVVVDEDGILDIPDVTEGDHAGLIHSGFVPVVEGKAKAAPKSPAAPLAVSASAPASDA